MSMIEMCRKPTFNILILISFFYLSLLATVLQQAIVNSTKPNPSQWIHLHATRQWKILSWKVIPTIIKRIKMISVGINGEG